MADPRVLPEPRCMITPTRRTDLSRNIKAILISMFHTASGITKFAAEPNSVSAHSDTGCARGPRIAAAADDHPELCAAMIVALRLDGTQRS